MVLSAFLSRKRDARRVDVAAADGQRRGFQGGFMVSRRVSRLLVLTCLILSVVASNYAVKYVQLNALFEFRKLSANGVESIKSEVMTYAQVLTGTAAHVAALEDVDQQEFSQYVAGLDLRQNFPGILGIGFVQSVPQADIAALQVDLSRIYDREITIGPQTKGADKMIVTHMTPLRGNETVIGLDTSFDEGRREAFAFARKTRQTTLTSQLELVQKSVTGTGFIMVRAVYVSKDIAPYGRASTDMFLGWVVAPFIGESVLADMAAQLGQDFQLTVFDGEARAENLLFSSDPQRRATGIVQRDHIVELYGRSWRLRFESTPSFDAAHASFLPGTIFLTGLLFSLMLWFSLRSTALRSRLLKTLVDQRGRQLDASADENRTLLESSALAVMTLDADARIVFINSTAVALFGYEIDDYLGAPFDQFVTLGKAAQTGGISNAVGIAARGERLKLDVQANTWRTADDVVQTTVLIRDVTEQIQNKLAIEGLHKRYNTALIGAGIGIFEVDILTGAADMSATWHKIMGTDALDEPFDHKKHFLARVHLDDMEALQEADRRCIAGETLRSEAEYRIRFADGWRWMYSDAVPVARGADGRATRLIGTQADITELRHARNALELSEARFRMVLQDAPVGMAILDDKGAFIGANAALATLSGYDADAMRKTMRLADLLARKDYVQMSRDIRALLGAVTSRTYQNQFQLKTHSGEVRWGLFNFSWTYDKNRAENVYIVQIVDISDQKRVERIKSEFVSTVSHELRTPLTSIKGALSLLEMSAAPQMPDNAKRLLEIACANADRLTVMVNDILDLEKLSSGDVMFECEDTALHPLVADTIDAMVPVAEEHQNTLVLETTTDDVEVHVDVGRMRQVLTNLISNACKFSDAQTPVTLCYDVRETDVIIYVKNIGPPVPESFRSHMFEAFTQGDGSDTRSKGGTGLGLHIVRQIVKRLGGRIGFEQGQDRQTVFWFTCPLAVSGEVTERVHHLEPTTQGAQMPRVLHVEDDRDFADVIAAGFDGVARISHASSIAQARQLIDGTSLDVLLLDWVLPDGHAEVLLDDIYARHPAAVVMGLSAAATMPDDPRIAVNLIKSQLEITDIVDRVLLATQDRALSDRKVAI
ncbi:CHASE domain-containing protein [uncultured Sulfitobacter sp.]|uniref:CHASE domain-containing protein n=1 Tax=uncultured Sulfitobacter sp. TaxID=191468 RepID=UPI002623D270|nr:CHASE domain-containing protein [uncultured Sulfitobacter sp.]